MKITIGSLIDGKSDEIAIAFEQNEILVLRGHRLPTGPFPSIYLKAEEILKLKEFLNGM